MTQGVLINEKPFKWLVEHPEELQELIESLEETLEVLSDFELLKAAAEGEEQIERGEFISLDEIIKRDGLE